MNSAQSISLDILYSYQKLKYIYINTLYGNNMLNAKIISMQYSHGRTDDHSNLKNNKKHI